MQYDKDDLHVRNLALNLAISYAPQVSRDVILEIAAEFEDFLRNGITEPEGPRRTFSDLAY